MSFNQVSHRESPFVMPLAVGLGVSLGLSEVQSLIVLDKPELVSRDSPGYSQASLHAYVGAGLHSFSMPATDCTVQRAVQVQLLTSWQPPLHCCTRLCLEPSPRYAPMQAEWFVKEGVGLSAEATVAEPVEGGEELNRCAVGDGSRWRRMKHSHALLASDRPASTCRLLNALGPSHPLCCSRQVRQPERPGA